MADRTPPKWVCRVCRRCYCAANECSARDGFVWVTQYGWASPDLARILAAEGRVARWDDVWTETRGSASRWGPLHLT